jgi:hypothetical protein
MAHMPHRFVPPVCGIAVGIPSAVAAALTAFLLGRHRRDLTRTALKAP